MTQNTDDVPETALQWLREGHKVALATVVSTWGSSPLQPGSMLAVRDDGRFTGSVSGGCIEADVVSRALDAISSNQSQHAQYGVDDKTAWEVGLACGGSIRLLIEPIADHNPPT